MEENTTENFIFYRSYYEAISEFSADDRLALYDALIKFAFEGIETEFTGMKKAIFSMATPLISASIKNYQRGSKGGRPARKEPTLREVSNAELANFIADYQTYKNSEYEFSDDDIELVRKTLSKLKEYNRDYWIKIFKTTKIGFEIEGKIVPCQLKKILSDHNKIYSGEIKFAVDKEAIAKRNAERKKEQEEQEKIITEQNNQARDLREQERQAVTDEVSAIQFLNKHIPKNLMAMRIASDFKDFKKLYPIILNETTMEYELCQG